MAKRIKRTRAVKIAASKATVKSMPRPMGKKNNSSGNATAYKPKTDKVEEKE